MIEPAIAPKQTVHELPAEIHGRYHVVEPSVGGPAPLLLGFHGYGENATRHLAQMRRIPGSGGWRLCAVEALHRFYNTKTGEVVGSWMTKEAREQAIVDNVGHVLRVVAAVQEVGPHPDSPVVVTGFSQGVAMAYRAALALGHACHGIVALAGDVPSDVVAAGKPIPAVLLGRGSADSWYTEDKMNVDCAVLAGRDVTFEVCVFDAGHVWTSDFRDAAGVFLSRIRSAG